MNECYSVDLMYDPSEQKTWHVIKCTNDKACFKSDNKEFILDLCVALNNARFERLNPDDDK